MWMLTDVIWLALVCSTQTACGQPAIRASQRSEPGYKVDKMHEATLDEVRLSEAHIGQ